MHSILADTPVVLLVGGRGTRLRSVVADRPKPLAEVCGRPFLAHLLDQLVRGGARDVVFCTGYLADAIEATFGDTYGPLRLRYVVERSPLGTGGAVVHALSETDADTLLVMNGDSYVDVDLARFAAQAEASAAPCTMVTVRVPDTSRFGTLCLAPDNSVVSFDEKRGVVEPGWINAGIYRFDRSVLEALPADRPLSLEREVLPTLVGRGLRGCRTTGAFLDIGTPESYARADLLFAALH